MLTEPGKTSILVAENLASMWFVLNTPQFSDHVLDVYGVDEEVRTPFASMRIVEVTDGDVHTGRIGSVIRTVWQVDNHGLRLGNDEFDSNAADGAFVLHPVFKFFLANQRIAVGERLGPELSCHKTADLVETGKGICFENIQVTWRISPNSAFCVKG